jgi:hypothetical protein
MVSVTLHHEGVEVQPLVPVKLSFPTLGAPRPACEDFRLFGFNVGTGLWEDEGGGEVRNDRFYAEVSHFSYWNCDAPAAGDGCIDVSLTRDGAPLENTEVGVWLSNGTAASPTTDSLGAFRIPAPVGAVVTLGIILDSAGRTAPATADAVWSVGPITVPEAAEGCADAGTFAPTGVDQDGDGQAIAPWGEDCNDLDAADTDPCPGYVDRAFSGGTGGAGGAGAAVDTCGP